MTLFSILGPMWGGITCLMSRVVGMRVSVEAFEPHPDIFKKLVSNASKNSTVAENVVQLHEVALSEHVGRTTLVETGCCQRWPRINRRGKARFHHS